NAGAHVPLPDQRGANRSRRFIPEKGIEGRPSPDLLDLPTNAGRIGRADHIHDGARTEADGVFQIDGRRRRPCGRITPGDHARFEVPGVAAVALESLAILLPPVEIKLRSGLERHALPERQTRALD